MSRAHASDVVVYAPRAAPLYLEGGGPVNGAERRAGHIASALAASGLRVIHVLDPLPCRRLRDDTGQVVPLVMHLRPGDRRVARYRGIAATLAAADAGVYIQVCAGFETGLVGTWARVHGRRFVFSSSSDADFIKTGDPSRGTGGGLELRRIMLQYRLGILMADRVVVQTKTQRELARRRFGIESLVIPSLAALPQRSSVARDAFLWVGGIVDVKDPLAYVELARLVPEARFLMVGTERPTGRDLADRLRSESADVPNLELLPPMSSEAVLGLYGRAVALVNTSFVEGFPNVFLESWAAGTPVLSLRVDPDEVIETHGLGLVSGGSMESLAVAARRLWAERDSIDPDPYRAYVAGNHDPAVVGASWAGLVNELLRA